MKSFMKKALIRTAAYFTVCAACFSILVLILYSGEEEGANLSALRTFLLLPFSFCFGIANTLLYCDKPGPAGRWTIHCLLTVVSAFLCLILPSTTDARGSERLMGFLTVLIVYVISAAVLVFTVKRVRKLNEESKKYKKKV